jgi:opacity protein-like surface antigen
MNINASTNGAWPAEHNLSGRGYGMTFGSRPAGNIKTEFEFGSRRFGLNSYAESDHVAITELMFSVMLEKEYFGFLRPYAGAGIGLSIISNNIEYEWSYAVGSTIYWKSGEKDVYRFNFAYQGLAGLTFVLSERFDLDFGIIWQNLGKVGNRVDHFDIVGNVTNLEYRIGVAYKW